MLTVTQHERLIDQISGLSELELAQLLSDIGTHLRKNNLEHLVDETFLIDRDYEGEIESLEDKVDGLQEEIERIESDKQHLQVNIDEAVELLEELLDEDFSEEWGKDRIEQTIKILK